MRAVRFEVSGELLREALHMPLTAEIVGAEMTRYGVMFTVTDMVPDAPEPHDVLPSVTHIVESWVWNWNVPE